MISGKLVIFSAPSGAGKTSIVRYLLGQDLNLSFSISACTRQPREGEKNGRDYYFMTVRDFLDKIKRDEFVEWEEVYKDHYYGTLRSEVQRIWQKGQHIIFDVDVKGGLNLKRQFDENALAFFVRPPSLAELSNRLVLRSTDSQEEISIRLKKAEEELQYDKYFDIILINDNLEVASNEAYRLVREFLEKD